MIDSSKKIGIRKTTPETNETSFFRAADLDLSDSLPEKPVSRLKGSFASLKFAPVKDTSKKVVSEKGAIEKKVSSAPIKPVNQSYLEYEKFRQKRTELTDMFTHTADIMQKLNMLQLEKKLSDLGERVKRDTFKIQIVGNFKNGKSTFINSFLGENVLPAYALPCTAVINEVKYGTKKRGVIHFKNPLPKTLPGELSPEAVKHIQSHMPGPIPPLEVAYDKIEEYVVIPVGKDPKDMLLESPYERVELFWPLELLKNGIEIIDSPGLNEHTTRTKVTMDFLTKSDAIIFVLNATMLCSRDEMSFIENSLHGNGFKDLFFVVNRFDMIPEGEKERIREYAKKNLVPMTNLGEKGIFFVSAKDALKARMQGDENSLVSSGMPHLERVLSKFLTKKKGSMKLVSPARAVLNFLKEESLKKILPGHRQKLTASSAQIGKDCERLQETMKALARKKELFQTIMQSDIQQVTRSYTLIAREHLLEVAGCVPYWLQYFEPSQPMSKETIMLILYELMEYLRLNLEKNNTAWCAQFLLPWMREQKKFVVSSVTQQVSELVKSDENTSENIFKQFNARFAFSSDAKGDLSLQTVTGLSFAPLLSVMTAFNSEEMKQRVSAVFLQKFVVSAGDIVKLRNMVSQEVAGCIINISNEYATSFSGEVSVYLSKSADKTLVPIDEKISSLQDKFEMMSANNGMKKADMDSKKEALNRTEEEIKLLCEQLHTYIASF